MLRIIKGLIAPVWASVPIFCLSTALMSAQTRVGASEYVLGPGDEVNVYVSNVAELTVARTYRVDPQGDVDIPLAGRLRAGGRTVAETKADIIERLKQYVYEPQISVDVQTFRSQPVSIIGAVNEPGVHQLEGQKMLLEVLSMAKGLRSDASDRLHITRRAQWGAIPLADARLDGSGKFYVADLNLKGLIDGRMPGENIQVKPNDVISIPTADLVYVIGAVNRPGGFILNERKSMSVLQALSLAGGLSKEAAAKKSRILRSNGTSKPLEVPLNVKDILAGKSNDLGLQGSDILFVPDNTVKTIGGKIAEAALQAAIGAAIYRPW
jgi:polysaccharide biosynthesis/export protein